MDEDLKAFRKYLKRINVTSLRKLCSKAGFTEEDTQYITLYYGDNKSECFIADSLNMGVDAYHNVKMRLLQKLQHFCRTDIYRHEITNHEERMRLIDDFLRKN